MLAAWIGLVVNGIVALTSGPHPGEPYQPGLFIGLFTIIFSASWFGIYWISGKPYVNEKSRYRLWERGAESVGVVNIDRPVDDVRQAVFDTLSEDPRLRIHQQQPGWFWVSLGKNYDRVGHWMAAYLVSNGQSTTLTLGIWTRRNAGYNNGRSKRRVTKLFDSISAKLAPSPLITGTYQHNAIAPTANTTDSSISDSGASNSR